MSWNSMTVMTNIFREFMKTFILIKKTSNRTALEPEWPTPHCAGRALLGSWGWIQVGAAALKGWRHLQAGRSPAKVKPERQGAPWREPGN